MSKYTRFALQERSILYNLFSEYADLLIKNKYNELIKIPNYYSIIKVINKLNKKSFFSKLKKKNKKKINENNESFNYYY